MTQEFETSRRSVLGTGLKTGLAVPALSIAGAGLASNALLPSVASAANNPPRSGSVSSFKTLRSYPPAPKVAFQDEQGRDKSTRDFRGKPILVTFWRTNCHACVYEMPTLDKVYKRATNAGYKVLPISIDQGGSALKRIRGFYKRKGLGSLPIYTDKQMLMFSLYNGFATPMSFIVDKQGHVAGGIAGMASWDTQEAWDLLSYYA